MNEFMFGAIIGSIISGAVVGAIPAICGAVKHKIGLAVAGFFSCLVASFILGLILAVPTCAVFMFFIFKKEIGLSSCIKNIGIADACQAKEFRIIDDLALTFYGYYDMFTITDDSG